MIKKRLPKLVHEGNYAAEVDVELIYTDDEWSPYLSLSDAEKLDTVRVALRRGDFKVASELARVLELVPLAALPPGVAKVKARRLEPI